MAVAQRIFLFDELKTLAAASRSGGVGILIARGDDDTDFLDAAGKDLLDDNAQSGFGGAVAVDKGLQWESTLAFACGGDNGFFDFHRIGFVRE
jgi:hypothetical protein